LLVLGVLIFLLWPRCLIVEPQLATLAMSSLLIASSGARAEGTMDVKITNDNLWGVDLDKAAVDVVYRGTTLATGHTPVTIDPSATKTVTFAFTSGSLATLELARVVLNYASDCNPITNTLPMTAVIKIDVAAVVPTITIPIDFHVRCAGAGVVVQDPTLLSQQRKEKQCLFGA